MFLPPAQPISRIARDSRRRGTILLFVVAILSLLVVMGTAYIVMARNDKAGVRSNSEALNADQAQDAVFNELRGKMLDTILDAKGNMLANYNLAGDGAMVARSFDISETGNPFGVCSLNPSFIPAEPWLCSALYPGNNTGDVTLLAPARFDPSTGLFDVPNPPAAEVDVLGPIDVNAAANYLYVNPTAAKNNAIYYLLPFSSPSGVHWRYAERVIDTSRMANLNLVNPDASAAANGGVADNTGQYLSSTLLPYSVNGATPLIAAADAANAKLLQNAAIGRGGAAPALLTTSANYFAAWHQQILYLEKPLSTSAAFFDPSDELEYRTYGCTGTNYSTRPQLAAGLATTLQPNVANPAASYRRNLTAWSFDRNFRPYADPTTPYNITGTVPGVWPVQPRKVWVNPLLSMNLAGATKAATAALNIATAMRAVNYSANERLAFAANYLTYRAGGVMNGTMYTTYHPGSGISTPTLSFVDTTNGICIRWPGNYNTVIPTTLNADIPAQIAFGYVAQPFITELVANLTGPVAPAPNPTYNAQVVQLYNPYPVILDVTGFKLKSGATTLVNDLGDNNHFPAGIPANSYVIVYNDAGGVLGLTTIAGQVVSDTNLAFDPTGANPIVLTRPYMPWNGGLADAPIDSFATSQFPPAAPPGPAKKTTTLQRPFTVVNNVKCYTNAYYSTAAAPAFRADSTVAFPAGMSALRLYDHNVDFGVTQGLALLNIADFNHIARIAGNPNSPITAQIQNLPTTGSGPLAGSQFPFESQVYFDFLATPTFYSAPNPLTFAPAAGSNCGDPRAITLLDYIAVLDRASDTTIDIGCGPTDINKIRIPGRINVNTAQDIVLRPLLPIGAPANPPPALPPYAPALVDQIVADICAYRWRLAQPYTLSYNPGYTVTSDVFPAANAPGYGIRSISELYCPIAQALATSAATTHMVIGNINDRDQAWASILNKVTVRSDTFAVNGVLEAISPTPNAGHNNGTDWYVTHNTKQKVLYRRRFIAIFDRGFADYPRVIPNGVTGIFTLPRIVAYKELPN